jgi:O-antigen ligase
VTPSLAVPDAVAIAGLLALGGCVAAALAWPATRGRTFGLAGTLVLAPALLAVSVAGSSQLHALGRHPAVLAAAGIAAIVALALLARLFARRPDALPVLAVVALPFRVPIQAGGSTANLLLPLYGVIAAAVLAELGGDLRRRSTRAVEPAAVAWRPGRLEGVLAFTVLLYAIQASYSDDLPKALQQTVFFYAPFALLYGLFVRRSWTARLLGRCLMALVALALVFGALGFYEWTTKSLLLNPRLLISNDFHAYFRVNSFFFDPNIYGRFLALVMLAVIGAMLYVRERRALVAGVIALAILWGSLVLTLSQSSLAALLFGLVVLAALRWRARRVLALAGGVVAALAIVALAFPSALGVDLSSSGSVNSATSGRLKLIDGGLQLFERRPLTGYGSASFTREYRRRHRSGGTGQAVSASHTIPVTIAAEQGIPGLATYLALLVVAAVTLLRGAGREPARAVIAAAFLALVLHTLTYADFLEDPLAWVLLGLGAALAGTTARGPQAA